MKTMCRSSSTSDIASNKQQHYHSFIFFFCYFYLHKSIWKKQQDPCFFLTSRVVWASAATTTSVHQMSPCAQDPEQRSSFKTLTTSVSLRAVETGSYVLVHQGLFVLPCFSGVTNILNTFWRSIIWRLSTHPRPVDSCWGREAKKKEKQPKQKTRLMNSSKSDLLQSWWFAAALWLAVTWEWCNRSVLTPSWSADIGTMMSWIVFV